MSDERENRKERERALRREVLLEAAERVFGRKPFDEATMQEVAAEAQIGMQGLYEHFPSKQVLYEELILGRAEAYQRRVTEAVAGVKEPLEQLRALARVKVSLFLERPGFFPVFAKERLQWEWQFDSRFTQRFFAIYEAERQRLKTILEAGLKGKKLRPADPEFLVQLCIETLQSSMLYMHRHRPEEGVDACVDRALDFFLRGAEVRR